MPSNNRGDSGISQEHQCVVSPLYYFPVIFLAAVRLTTVTAGFTFDGSFIVGGSDEGSGLEVTHAETGDKIHTFKTLNPCPVVAWAPTRYWLAYGDGPYLCIVGIDGSRK